MTENTVSPGGNLQDPVTGEDNHMNPRPPTLLRRALDRIQGDEELFLTHTAGDWCQPGQRWTNREGEVYRITRLKPERPTALLGGGRASCWQVRGTLDLPTWEDHAVKAMDLFGVLPYIERLAGWLARRLPAK